MAAKKKKAEAEKIRLTYGERDLVFVPHENTKAFSDVLVCKKKLFVLEIRPNGSEFEASLEVPQGDSCLLDVEYAVGKTMQKALDKLYKASIKVFKAQAAALNYKLE